MRVFVCACVLALACILSARASAQCSAIPSQWWRNSVDITGDQLINYGNTAAGAPWVKFTILVCDPTRVYFQHSTQYQFHYDFAHALLNPFTGMTRAQYDAVTLHATNQEAILGAVLVSPFTSAVPGAPREFGIQLVRNDAYTKEQVRDIFNTVRAALTNANGSRGYYMPTYEQRAAAEPHAAWFAEQGMPLADTGRWAVTDPIYAKGWAIGTLKYVPVSNIPGAYASGQLTHADILLTDGIPAELPYLAGIVSLAAGTPNSHVALLAQTYGTPCVALLNEQSRAEAQALVGRRVLLRAHEPPFRSPRVDLVDASSLQGQQLAEVLALKNTGPLAITPMQLSGVVYRDCDQLSPADISRVGGKAANYGILRRSIPESARKAMALTFDVWSAYLDQPLSNGNTLRQEIQLRLGAHQWPPNPQQLSGDLAYIRSLFTGPATTFSPGLQASIIAALQDPAFNFDPNTKIRFRSSTNVEDSASYTGAGLYDSFSGCLADDLDADTVGPSICDPAEANERGVFRAIKRVFASFYNDNAFSQRLRLGVNESQVGMAILVHHSFPDETELANGVAVLERVDANYAYIHLTLQPGALSVTNPPLGVIPEQVDLEIFGGIYPRLIRSSNLVQLGDSVMEMPDDYVELGQYIMRAAARYVEEGGGAMTSLDFEFKKTVFNGGMIEVKQIRPLPQPSTTPSITPFMLGTPMPFVTYQGELREPLGTMRMKTALTITARGQWLTEANRAAGLIDSIEGSLDVGCDRIEIAGPITALPQHAYSNQVSGARTTGVHAFRVANVPNPRTYSITVPNIPLLVAPSESPVLLLSDFGNGTSGGHYVLPFEAVYNAPVPIVPSLGGPTTTIEDGAALCALSSIRPVRTGLVDENTTLPGVSVRATYWHPAGVDLAAGYTAPVVGEMHSTITGLTTAPLQLSSDDAQVFIPHHHNFGISLLYEPRRDPAVTARQLRELRRRNADLLFFQTSGADMQTRFFVEPCARCDADIDDGSASGRPDGGVTIDDLIYMLTQFEQGTLEADLDDGSNTGAIDDAVTIDDLIYMLRRFEAGC